MSAILRADIYKEATTGMAFPDVCDAWARSRVDENPDKRIGVSVAYSIKNGSAITCRIFDGQFGNPSADPAALLKEIKEIASGITVVWERMGGKVDLALQPGPLPQDPKQYIVGHRIYIGNTENISITSLLYYRGRYLCFRFTTLGSDGTAAFNELGRFLAKLSEENRKEPNKTSEPTAMTPPPSATSTAPLSHL